jgi:hypothetical protein
MRAVTLAKVFKSCRLLDTLCFSSCARTCAEHVAAIVEHGRSLRAFSSHEGKLRAPVQLQARQLGLQARLPQLEHLALHSLHCASDALILLVAGHCGRLKSLSRPRLRGASSAALVTLFSRLPLLEELDLSYCYVVTNEVLRAILQGCPRLRRVSLVGSLSRYQLNVYGCDDSLLESLTALLTGCASLTEVNIGHADGALIDRLRAQRPDVTISKGTFFVGEYWQASLCHTRWVETRDADSYEESSGDGDSDA